MKGEQTMKKSLTIIALAALVMLAGCKKNDPKPNGTRLIAGIEKHKSDSKTSLDGLQIKWTEGDKLYVNNGTEGAQFTLTSGAGTATGEFATNGDYTFAAENNLAVYPYNDNITVSGTTVTMTLPAEQTASGAGSFGNGANPMLGTFSDMDNLMLTSLCGVLCLQLTGNAAITAIEIVGGPDDKLNGTFTVDYTSATPALAKSGDDGTNTVRLNFPENVTLTSTAQKFYVVVPAGTLHGFTMKVYDDNNNEIFSKSTANEVPVFVNTLSTMVPVEVVPFNPLTTPLTFEAKTAGSTVRFELKQIDGVEYSTDGNTWQPYTTNTTITLTDVGDKVMFRGSSNTYFGLDGYNDPSPSHFHCDGQCYLYGNVMSLTSPTDFASATTVVEKAFYELFDGNDNFAVYNHPTHDIVLPATTVGNQGYYKMFNYCKSLTRAPELPADNLGSSCYYMMFSGCSSLTEAPVQLPATTLASNCYQSMFAGCSSLTTAPALNATTLAYYCCASMFSGCSGLTAAPVLPATSLAEGCYNMMFRGCSSLQTAPALPATTLANSCYYMMFQDCSNLATVPDVLPATTLAYFCYSGMFKNCTSLTKAPDLPATTLVSNCYNMMFNNCSQLNSIKCLATTNINSNGSTGYWVDGVASSGTFTKASGASWSTGMDGIPTGWTEVDYSDPSNPNGNGFHFGTDNGQW